MPLVRTLLVALIYFTGARLGYAFAVGAGTVTLWPPAGIMLALLLLYPRHRWAEIVAGGFSGSVASDLLSGYSIPLAGCAAAANLAESLAAAVLLRAWLGSAVTFSTLRGVLALTVGAVGAVNAMGAILGGTVLVYGFRMSFPHAWFVWFVGDGLGMLMLAPLLVSIVQALDRRHRMTAGKVIEAIALLACLALAGVVALGPQRQDLIQPREYLAIPFVFWAALRFGTWGATTSTMIVAAIAVFFASQGMGPFSVRELGEYPATLQVYTFLAIVAVSALVAAAAVEERRRSALALADSRKRYQNVVDTATDAVITIDGRSRILFANRSTERIFGYAPEELIGRDLTLLMPPGVRQAHSEALARYLSTRQRRLPWQGVALTGQHKAGREIPLEVSFGEHADGEMHEFTGILRDVTEKRAAEATVRALEEQYRQSQKMEAIGRLAGGIAHDFNNLLTVIQGNCDLLRGALRGGSPEAADLEQIRLAAERAAALTRQLLTFSRQQLHAPRPVDLAARLTSMEPMLRRLIGPPIQIEVRPHPVGAVLVDPSQIELVILNLAVNARDAMPDGGVLTIETAESRLPPDAAAASGLQPGDYVVLTVTDTGVGMDDETRRRVFEPFFTTKPVGAGTGIGLATAHGVVTQSGGTIDVASTVGSGTTFRVFLPRIAGDSVLPEESAPVTSAPPQKATILIVEDEEPVARLARRILSDAGYRILTAGTPAKALELGADTHIDLLITDVLLPEVTGPVLAERLKEGRPDLKVLFMSGYPDDAFGRHEQLATTTAFLQKPFSRSALLKQVAAVLGET